MKLHTSIAALKASLFTLFFASMNASAVAETIASLTAPDEKGQLILDLRSRLEHVEQGKSLRNATVSTRLGYKSASFQGFTGLFEVEGVRAMAGSYYSDTNGKIRHSVTTDPENTEINRAYISYAGMFDTAFTYGRQHLMLDNSRFVDNVGWRQDEQTFDVFKVENTSFTGTKITLAYVDKVHRIFGDDSARADVDMQSPIIDVQYKGSPMLNVSGYGYFLSFDNNPAASRQTSGIRVKGEYPLSGIALLYAAEYARQSDYKDGLADINADYRHLAAGVRFPAITTEIGYENLSGDGEYAFQTPLATGHAFNGWADQFLVTPLNGLTDVYISADTLFAGAKWKAIYHNFSADRGGVDYGSELNLLVVKVFAKRYTLGLKYASYFADDFNTDTEKIQIYAQISI